MPQGKHGTRPLRAPSTVDVGDHHSYPPLCSAVIRRAAPFAGITIGTTRSLLCLSARHSTALSMPPRGMVEWPCNGGYTRGSVGPQPACRLSAMRGVEPRSVEAVDVRDVPPPLWVVGVEGVAVETAVRDAVVEDLGELVSVGTV